MTTRIRDSKWHADVAHTFADETLQLRPDEMFKLSMLLRPAQMIAATELVVKLQSEKLREDDAAAAATRLISSLDAAQVSEFVAALGPERGKLLTEIVSTIKT